MIISSSTLVTVIVPVYNASTYLRECINSIINQTYRNLEIILVNDGSLDDSGQICDEYAEKDKRVRVIHKKNQGVSEARNSALHTSNGEYIGFLDADDTLEDAMIETLLKKATGVDITLCYYNDMEITGEKTLHWEPLIEGYYNRGDITHRLIPDLIGTSTKTPQCSQVMGSICRCLFHHKIIKISPALQFYKVKLAEDLLFLIEYLSRCNSAHVIPRPLYNYRKNELSATRFYMADLFKNVTTMTDKLRQILISNSLYTPEIETRFHMSAIYNIVSCITNECHTANKCKHKLIYNKIKEICKNEYLKKLTWGLIFKIKSKEIIYYSLIKLRMYYFILKFTRRNNKHNL